MLKEYTLEQGKVLTIPHDNRRDVYLIQEGEVVLFSHDKSKEKRIMLAKYGRGELINESHYLLRVASAYGSLVLRNNFKALIICEKFFEEVCLTNPNDEQHISFLKNNLLMKNHHASKILERMGKMDEALKLRLEEDLEKKFQIKSSDVGKELKAAEFNCKLDKFNKMVGRKDEGGATKVSRELIGLVTPKLTSKTGDFNSLNLKQQQSLMTLKGIASKAKFGDDKVIQNIDQKK